VVEEFMLANCGCVGYWQGVIPKVLADIGACRPTLFCGVPRVFDRIYAGINDQLAANWFKRVMFWLCMARKRAYMVAGWKHDKVRRRGGGEQAEMTVFEAADQNVSVPVRLPPRDALA
jgi:long-chain acyl-CoA synthetase